MQIRSANTVTVDDWNQELNPLNYVHVGNTNSYDSLSVWVIMVFVMFRLSANTYAQPIGYK